MRTRARVLASLSLAISACATAPDASVPLGTTERPVRASTFLGEFEYLTRLECPDGTKPHIRRLPLRERGSYGDMVNGYRVRCIYLNREVTIYIDPRHEHVELEPVPGFHFSRPPDRARLFWLEANQRPAVAK